MSYFIKKHILIVIFPILFIDCAIAQSISVNNSDKKDSIFLLTLKKDTIRLHFSKKFTIVGFFSIYCKPCLVELNSFQKNYQKWNDSLDINIMGITSSFDYVYYDKIVKFAEKKKYDFPLFIDVKNSFTLYSYSATPSEKEKYFKMNNDVIEIIRPQMFIFDSNGKIIYHKRAFQEGEDEKIFDFLTNWNE